ncbi:hypothetical protein ACTFIR_000751 [Dictyostelium discoideum]
MFKILIAILVIFSLLSNLNAVSADKTNCIAKCAYASPNFYKLCTEGIPGAPCRMIYEKCAKGCPTHD